MYMRFEETASARTDTDKLMDAAVIADRPPYRTTFSRAQRDLLDLIPVPGSTISLDEALQIVGHDHTHPYGQIIVLMNRGVIDAEYDRHVIDPEIVLRRL
ncbi:hypothetical protein D3218_07690 [Aureimonas flava]|uniref:Uncharacterized protein n=1 Tax=Aureimonas flava TaxID=2320271 RepID=A0A3A1WLL9_9HYPH|nr:hypothetical protein [Aureimonas flava]RIY01246.1 hypothetical protein D3218_07690 [Aureimonas flava]